MRIKLGAPLGISEIEMLFSGRACTGCGTVEYISTDSREVLPRDLFTSLSPIPIDSLKHTSEARQKGALTLGRFGDIRASSGAEALLMLAAHYKKTRLTALKHTVAVTGSVGKTTTKEFIKRILDGYNKTHASRGNYNNKIGLPLTILEADPDTEVLVLECGMNAPGEISELSRCCSPDIAVITNIGTAHIGMLGSREAIARAKLEILDGMSGGVLICPGDEPLLECSANRITFCIDGGSKASSCAENSACDGAFSNFTDKENINSDTRGAFADYTASDISKCGEGLSFTVIERGGDECGMYFPVYAPHLIPNVLIATAVARRIGMSLSEISVKSKLISNELLRHRFIDAGRFVILDDAYNSSLESARCAIDLLLSRSASRHTAVLGDILELGEHAPRIHASLGSYAAGGIDRIIAVGDNAEYIKQGALGSGMSEGQILVLPGQCDIEYIAEVILKTIIDGELILIKGSHGTGLWKLSGLLLGGLV